MEHNPQTERPTRREQANADSISQAKQVIDQIEQIINEGYRFPIRKEESV